jgi:hypothetical protein
MKPKIFFISSIVLILSLLAACGRSPKKTATPLPTPTTQPTPTETPWPASPMQFLKVGDYQFVLECQGEGSPTIILENGLDQQSWTSTFRFKDISRTCIYSRAGSNGIDTITRVRTVEDQVQDLHSLLAQSGESGPYILVGYDTAGYNLILYADQYPTDVVGMVCVDCCYTSQLIRNMLKTLGEKYNDTWDASDDLRSMLKWSLEVRHGNNRERVDFTASETHLQQVTSLGDIPFIMLVSGPYEWQKDPYISFGLDKIEAAQAESISKLSSRGRAEVFPDIDSGNMIVSNNLKKAIQEVVDAARQAP